MSGLPAGDVERLHAAARAIRDRTPAQAERLLGEVLARHPAHAEALRLLAILQLHTQRAPEAVATLQEAIARHPGDALLHADLGNAHSARGERDAAIAAWRRATGLDPTQPVPWFNLGRALQLEGDSHAAVAALETACALAPGLLPATILLADGLARYAANPALIAEHGRAAAESASITQSGENGNPQTIQRLKHVAASTKYRNC